MAQEVDEIRARAQMRVGTVLRGKYQLEGILGIGGMATVYSAVLRNGRRVALKMLHPALSTSPEVRTRFLREGKAATAVNHPGAVVVLDDGVADDGSAFLVMELLEGHVVESLWEQNERRLPPRTVMALGRELCTVLAAAHGAGIVHRDIKPENLFLTRDGRLKVLDFGIARVRDAMAPKLTHTGMVFGTPAFMAPEQASGRVSKIDGQTDVWGIGATMYTLASGALVHDGESAQHIIIKAATQRAPSLARFLPSAWEPMISLIDRALALEKKARWPSAEAMGQAIRHACLKLFAEAEPDLLGADELTRVHGAVSPREVGRRRIRLPGESSETEDAFPRQQESSDTRKEYVRPLHDTEFHDSASATEREPATEPDRAAIETFDELDALTRVRNDGGEADRTERLSPKALPIPVPVQPSAGGLLANAHRVVPRRDIRRDHVRVPLPRPAFPPRPAFGRAGEGPERSGWGWYAIGLGSLALSVFVVAALLVVVVLPRPARLYSPPVAKSVSVEAPSASVIASGGGDRELPSPTFAAGARWSRSQPCFLG